MGSQDYHTTYFFPYEQRIIVRSENDFYLTEMNAQREWRIQYATKLFNSLELVTEELAAAFIGGSVGGKHVDEYSDLELCFLWEHEIEVKLFEDFCDKEDLKIFHKRTANDAPRGIEYSLLKKAFQIDTYHYSTADFNSVKDIHLDEEKITLDTQGLFYSLLNCKVLKGEEYLKRMQVQIRNYPLSLSKTLVKKYIKNLLKADLNLFLVRKDWVLFYNLVSGYQKLIFLVLIALNRVYFPSYKNMAFHVEKLELKPSSVSLLYESIYELEPEKICELLINVQLDVLHFVREVYPEIDIEPNLSFLDFKRKANTGMQDLLD